MAHLQQGHGRLDLGLVIALHGFVWIGLFGIMLCGAFRIRDKDGKEQWHEAHGTDGRGIPLGLPLVLIGFGGLVIGRLIRNQVSRGREQEADRAAIALTKNPDAMARALRKMGGLSFGSRVDNAWSEEYGHLFFADPKASKFTTWFSSHACVTRRIQQFDPDFDGRFPEIGDAELAGIAARTIAARFGADPMPKPRSVAVASNLATSDNQADSLRALRSLLTTLRKQLDTEAAQLPPALIRRTRELRAAKPVLLALLLDRDLGIQQIQLHALEQLGLKPAVLEAFEHLQGVSSWPRRLAVLDLLLPTLSRAPAGELEDLVDIIETLISADQRCDLFEFVLQRVCWPRFVRAAHPLCGRCARPATRSPVCSQPSPAAATLALAARLKLSQQRAAAYGSVGR